MDISFGGGTEKSISTAYIKYAKFILFLERECDYNNMVKNPNTGPRCGPIYRSEVIIHGKLCDRRHQLG